MLKKLTGIQCIILVLLMLGMTACQKPVEVVAEPTPEPTPEPTATADPFEKDKIAYAEAEASYYLDEDYEKAYSILKDYSESGYAPVQELLGTLLYNGYGTERDFEKAAALLEKAAAQSNPIACYMMGEIKRTNTILGVDTEASAEYYTKSLPLLEEAFKSDPADPASGRIVRAIALQYAKGFGTEANLETAAKKANEYLIMDGNLPLACYRIASDMKSIGFGNGDNVFKDLLSTIQNLSENGNNEATRYLSNYYYYGDGDVEQNYETALILLSTAASNGDMIAQNDLAAM